VGFGPSLGQRLKARRKDLLDVERWAEIRRMRFVERLSIREIARRTGPDRTTVQRVIRSGAPPRYVSAPTGSQLDLFKGEIERLLSADPRLPGTRMRELLSELGTRHPSAVSRPPAPLVAGLSETTALAPAPYEHGSRCLTQTPARLAVRWWAGTGEAGVGTRRWCRRPWRGRCCGSQ
jgi:hypothetical protein